jgi:hypothetical protein
LPKIEKKPEVNVHGKIAPEQIHTFDEIDDPAALQLIVQDTETTDAWIDSKRFTLRWREADTLYQPPIGVQVWENTNVPRANVVRFTVATHVNSILPKLSSGLFYEDPPFLLRPRPGTSQNTIRAISAVEATQLDEMDFPEEIRRAFFSALVFGTLICKWGWHSETRQRKTYVRKTEPATIKSLGKVVTLPTKESDEFEVKESEEVIERPFIENKDIRYILVDPACRVPDIRKANFVIERMYLTFYDLEKLADETYFDRDGTEHKRYTLPSREEVKSWFEVPVDSPETPNAAEQASMNTTLVHHAAPRFQKTTADPLAEPLEVLERWDNGKVITCIQKIRLIRKEKNDFGCIPFYSCNWWDIPDAFWGMGLGRVLGQDQRVQQGLINALLDITALMVNPTYVRSAGANVPTQQIRQRIGGIIDVQGEVDKAFMLLEQPRIDPAIFAEIQQSEARAESTSGANEQLVQGAMPSQGRSSMGRTATGAGALAAATESRIGGFIESFIRNVYEPWLYQMHELNCERLPLTTLREILQAEGPNDFQMDAFKEEDYLNARFKFDVLAGAHLAAKQQMAQSMVMMIQLFENPPLMQQLETEGKKVDIEELFHMIHDLSGFKNYYDIIKPLTPEDKQRQQQQNPAVLQAQAKAQQGNQEFQHKQALIDQENEARAARDVLRQQLEEASKPGTIEGEGVGVKRGFGSNTGA